MKKKGIVENSLNIVLQFSLKFDPGNKIQLCAKTSLKKKCSFSTRVHFNMKESQKKATKMLHIEQFHSILLKI